MVLFQIDLASILDIENNKEKYKFPISILNVRVSTNGLINIQRDSITSSNYKLFN